MKIDNFRSQKRDGRVNVLATVTWEESDRPVQDGFFETDETFSEDFTCNSHSFLIGSIVPAFRYGEKRILIDGEICPELKDNLIAVLCWLRNWYYPPDRALLKIESKKWSTSTPLNSP